MKFYCIAAAASTAMLPWLCHSIIDISSPPTFRLTIPGIRLTASAPYTSFANSYLSPAIENNYRGCGGGRKISMKMNINKFTDPLLRIRHMIPPTIIPKDYMHNSEIHVFEPGSPIKPHPCILFFTGGNALITHEIYSNFLAKLSNKGVTIHTIPFKYKISEFEMLVEQLKSEYSEIVVLSHSSGSVPLIDAISQNPAIKKVVMMDPIDSRLDRTKRIRLKYVEKLLIVRAEKAYEGENLSFIPGFLELTEDKLRLIPECEVKVLDAEDYGHCDILNPMYSNMVHQYLRNICDGTTNRSHDNLYKYIDWITTEISKFAEPTNPPKNDGDSSDGSDGNGDNNDTPSSNERYDPCDEMPCDI